MSSSHSGHVLEMEKCSHFYLHLQFNSSDLRYRPLSPKKIPTRSSVSKMWRGEGVPQRDARLLREII